MAGRGPTAARRPELAEAALSDHNEPGAGDQADEEERDCRDGEDDEAGGGPLGLAVGLDEPTSDATRRREPAGPFVVRRDEQIDGGRRLASDRGVPRASPTVRWAGPGRTRRRGRPGSRPGRRGRSRSPPSSTSCPTVAPPARPAAPSVSATSSPAVGKRPSTRRRVGDPNTPSGACTSSGSIAPGTATSRWAMASTDPNQRSALSTSSARGAGVLHDESEAAPGAAPNFAVTGGCDVVRRHCSEHRRPHGNGHQPEDERLLPPLPPEHPDGPTHDRPTRGHATTGPTGPARASVRHRHALTPRSEQGLGAGQRRGVVDEPAVAEEDDPVGPRGQLGVVGDHDAGDAAPAGSQHEPHDALAVDGVEGPGGLVRQQQPPVADHRPGDRHSLALTAGQLVGKRSA